MNVAKRLTGKIAHDQKYRCVQTVKTVSLLRTSRLEATLPDSLTFGTPPTISLGGQTDRGQEGS